MTFADFVVFDGFRERRECYVFSADSKQMKTELNRTSKPLDGLISCLLGPYPENVVSNIEVDLIGASTDLSDAPMS